MSEYRLFDRYDLKKEDANRICREFDSGLSFCAVTPIHAGMSTSNYILQTDKRRFLLKIYSNGHHVIEPAMYKAMRGIVSVPEMYKYDSSDSVIPYPFAIIEWIDGVSLNEYIKENREYPDSIVSQVGEILAAIHEHTFEKASLLDASLNPASDVLSISEQTRLFVLGKAGKYLPDALRKRLLHYTQEKEDLYREIDSRYALCHGDMSFGNIIVAPSGKVYIIDFEYAFSSCRFYDIGKLFRRKEDSIQKYVNEKTYKVFQKSYNAHSSFPLPKNWLALARITDIPSMLSFLNRDDPPAEWINDIVCDINMALSDSPYPSNAMQ